MPDTTIPPGNPTVLRDTNKRSSEQRVGAPRRTSPGEARPPVASARARRATAIGPVARAERVGPRWRDIEWVDFTSDADSGASSEPAPAPMPPPDPTSPSAPDPDGARRHVVEPLAEVPAQQQEAVSGFVSRFNRPPVVRPPAQPLPPAPPEIAPLVAAPKTGSVIVHPRTPPAIPATEDVVETLEPVPFEPEPAPAAKSPLEPNAVPDNDTSPPHPALADEDAGPFPASIYTSTSISTPPMPPASPRLRATLAAQLGRVEAVLRDKSGTAVAAVSGGVGRATAALQKRLPRQPPAEAPPNPKAPPASAITSAEAETIEPEPPQARQRLIHGRLADTIDHLTMWLANVENRLRLSGLIVLVALFVALAAYAGGALIARLAGAGADTNKHVAASDQAIQTAPAAAPMPPPAPGVPSTDPAARAAFYLARAKTGDAAAQYDAGVLYARGDGLVQDYASAASWFHAAAAQGNVAAEYNLGVLYERGLGVPADEAEALNWYRSAADQNHPGAQFNLALAYAEGHGAKQDFAAAARWYQRAAQQGLTPAMVNLAILYERGDGVDRSPVDAYAWYSAAGERGDAGAKDRAGELFRQFSDKDIARAEGLAATIGAALDAAAPPS